MLSLLCLWMLSAAPRQHVAETYEPISVVCDHWEAPDGRGCQAHYVTTFGPRRGSTWESSEACCFGSRVLEQKKWTVSRKAFAALRQQVLDAKVFSLPSEYGCDQGSCPASTFPQYFLSFSLGNVDQMLLIFTDKLPDEVAALKRKFCHDIVH